MVNYNIFLLIKDSYSPALKQNMTKLILLLKLRQQLQDLFSFESFILNISKLTKANFNILNSFLGEFIKKIDTLLTPSPKLVSYSNLWRKNQDSGQSQSFGHSQNYKGKFNGNISSFLGDPSMGKTLKRIGAGSTQELYSLLSEWLSTLRFGEISKK